MKRNVQEFTLVWFESTQKWVAVLDDGTVLSDFPSQGAAHGAVCDATGRGEAEWNCDLDTGRILMFVKDDEYWVKEVTMEQLIVAANTVVGCYTRNPGNFASALRVLEETAKAASGGA